MTACLPGSLIQQGGPPQDAIDGLLFLDASPSRLSLWAQLDMAIGFGHVFSALL